VWVTRQLSGFMVRLSSAMFISCSGGNDAADELSPLDLLGSSLPGDLALEHSFTAELVAALPEMPVHVSAFNRCS